MTRRILTLALTITLVVTGSGVLPRRNVNTATRTTITMARK